MKNLLPSSLFLMLIFSTSLFACEDRFMTAIKEGNLEAVLNHIETDKINLNFYFCDKIRLDFYFCYGISEDFLTPAHVAIYAEQVEVLELLIGIPGFNINTQTPEGLSLLHVATGLNNLKVIGILLAAGIDTKLQIDTGETALDMGIAKNDVKIIKLLEDVSQLNKLQKDCHSCLIVPTYFSKHKPCDQMRDGRTVLHLHAKGIPLSIKQLIHCVNEVNATDNKGRTALHIAASEGNLEILEQLFLEGADVNIQDNHGEAALHKATDGKQEASVRQLLQHEKINVNIQKNDGSTALHLACWEVNFPVVIQLVNKKDIEVNIQRKDKMTPFDVTVYAATIFKKNPLLVYYVAVLKYLITHKDVQATHNVEEKLLEVGSKSLLAKHLIDKIDYDCSQEYLDALYTKIYNQYYGGSYRTYGNLALG